MAADEGLLHLGHVGGVSAEQIGILERTTLNRLEPSLFALPEIVELLVDRGRRTPRVPSPMPREATLARVVRAGSTRICSTRSGSAPMTADSFEGK